MISVPFMIIVFIQICQDDLYTEGFGFFNMKNQQNYFDRVMGLGNFN